jgi:hypothetical protein
MTETTTPGEALIASGAQVVKIEDDRMTSIALSNPRDEAKVQAEALAELERDPDYAAEIYYSIPFKSHTRREGCNGTASDSCPVENEVEGIGIEGARNLARRWRNNVSRVSSIEREESFELVGVFLDLETNQRIELPFHVSKLAVARDGSVYDLNPVRLQMAVQAAASKVARNAILAGIPAQIKRRYYEKAKELSAKVPVDVGALVAAYGALGVTREALEAYYGATLEELGDDQKRNVRSLYRALREGLLEPSSLFATAGAAAEVSARSDAAVPAVAPTVQGASVTGGLEAAPTPREPSAAPPGEVAGTGPVGVANLAPPPQAPRPDDGFDWDDDGI